MTKKNKITLIVIAIVIIVAIIIGILVYRNQKQDDNKNSLDNIENMSINNGTTFEDPEYSGASDIE